LIRTATTEGALSCMPTKATARLLNLNVRCDCDVLSRINHTGDLRKLLLGGAIMKKLQRIIILLWAVAPLGHSPCRLLCKV
jgi:hypothetical protein